MNQAQLSAFQRQLSGAVAAPAKVVTLPPSAFSDRWKGRPHHPVSIGLRLLSEDEVLEATKHAGNEADRSGRTQGDDLWTEAFNAALKRSVLVLAMCEPDDATKPYLKHIPNDTIRVAFLPLTIERLWLELDRVTALSSPSLPEATDDEIADLAETLADEPLMLMDAEQASRIRKLLAFVADEVESAIATSRSR